MAPQLETADGGTSVVFGEVVRSESVREQVEVVNTGGDSQPLTVTVSSGPFAASGDCANQALSAGARCTVSLDFSPNDLNPSASFLDVGERSGTGSLRILASGQGVAPLVGSPLDEDFGAVNVGDARGPRLFVFTNKSRTRTTAPLTLMRPDPRFEIDAGCEGRQLLPQESCAVEVWLRPGPGDGDGGVLASSLTLRGATAMGLRPAEEVTVTMRGQLYPPTELRLTPSNGDVGDVVAGSVRALGLTLTNTSSSVTASGLTFSVSPDAGEFSVDAGTCQGASLPPDGGCTFAVQFAPVAFGNRQTTVAATAMPGGTAYATLSGRGLDTFSLQVTVGGAADGGVLVSDAGLCTRSAGTCTFNAPRFTTLSLSAIPGDSTVTFGGWSGDCSGWGACSITLDGGSRAVGATFEPAPPLPAGAVIFWLKNAAWVNQTLPAGWAQADGQVVDAGSPLNVVTLPNLNGQNRFLRGGTTSGTTGGAATHLHAITTEVRSVTPGTNGMLVGTSTSSTNHEPPFYGAVAVVKVAGSPVNVPVGAVFGWANALTDAGIEPGWSPLQGGPGLPDANGQAWFIRAAGTSGGSGGSVDHLHSVGLVAGTTTTGSYSVVTGQFDVNTSRDGHLPPYYAVQWVTRRQNYGAPSPPVGAIIPWLKSLPGVSGTLPPEYAECNGQIVSDSASPLDGKTLPNLNGLGQYLRGATTSGSTGGAANHSHTLQASPSDPGTCTPPNCRYVFRNPLLTQSNDPPFYTVVYIIRVK